MSLIQKRLSSFQIIMLGFAAAVLAESEQLRANLLIRKYREEKE